MHLLVKNGLFAFFPEDQGFFIVTGDEPEDGAEGEDNRQEEYDALDTIHADGFDNTFRWFHRFGNMHGLVNDLHECLTFIIAQVFYICTVELLGALQVVRDPADFFTYGGFVFIGNPELFV